MWNCTKVLRYVPPPAEWARVGKYVKYSAAEVLRRRAARYAVVTVCTLAAAGAGTKTASLVPPAWIGLPSPPQTAGSPPTHSPAMPPTPILSMPPAPVWRDTGLPVHPVPEPGTAALLGVAYVFTLLFSRKR